MMLTSSTAERINEPMCEVLRGQLGTFQTCQQTAYYNCHALPREWDWESIEWDQLGAVV